MRRKKTSKERVVDAKGNCPFCGKEDVVVKTHADHFLYTCCGKEATHVELMSKMQRRFEPKIGKIIGDSLQKAINALGQDAALLSKDDANIISTIVRAKFSDWFYGLMANMKKSHKDDDLREIV